jgi:hydroxypyruvate isomerase
MMTVEPNGTTGASRRRMLQAAALAAASVVTSPTFAAEEIRRVKEGRFKQSIVHWCYKDTWTVEQLAPVARQLGCHSI